METSERAPTDAERDHPSEDLFPVWEIKRTSSSVQLAPCRNRIFETTIKLTSGWDDETRDRLSVRMLTVSIRVALKVPLHGDWCVNGHEVTVWFDASFLATSVFVESGGSLVEDACWLRPVHGNEHINLAQLDAMVRGVYLAL